MRSSIFPHRFFCAFALCFFVMLMPFRGKAQFQKHYGTSLDDSFSKVIPDGDNYYVLGAYEAVNGAPVRATVTRLDANGVHQWTLSMPTSSTWADAVLLPGGDLMVVGYSLPLDASAKSIIGRVTQDGAFSWLKSYDQPGRDFFNRVVAQAGSYYVLAGEIENGGSLDNVTLWNFTATGALNWKKYYISSADDEFVRDLVAIPGGGLLLAGNDVRGVIYTTDNNGEMTTTALTISDRVYRDVEANSSGGFYAAATNFPTGEAYLEKFDAELLLQWEIRINELNSISQVWEGLPGEVYITGNGNFGNQMRTVIIKLTDEANNGPSVSWVKYLHAGTNQTGGSAWLMPASKLAFTDARTLPGGFGQTCANISVSDLELSDACEVTTSNATLLFTDPVPDGPLTYIAESIPAPNAVNIIESFSLNWQEGVTCGGTPCGVELVITPLDDCGGIQVCANATGTPTYSYQWCNGSNTPCFNAQFITCGTAEYCVSVTCADGTVATASTSAFVSDLIPPVALCNSSLTVQLDANCTASITADDVDNGSFDNCQIASMVIDQGAFNQCGTFPLTLTVTDWCGNQSSCTTTVMVTDNTPPVIMCPPNFSQECDGNIPPAISGTATATDNCPVTITYSDQLFSLLNPLTEGICDDYIERTWKATDECGNMSTCIQTISVHDDVNPVLTNCPISMTVVGTLDPQGNCTANVQVISPSISDNCDPSPLLTNSFNGTANASGDYPNGNTTVTWTLQDDCGNVATCVFTVTVECNTCPCPIGSIPGPNLVDNPDFSLGDQYFTSSYTYTPSNQTEGQYWVGSTPQTFNSGFVACEDHTPTSDGNMLIVNGDGNPINAWAQSITVAPYTNYSFSCWIASLVSASPANLQFYINSTIPLSNGFQASSSTCEWQEFCETWYSGSGSSPFNVTISIVNINPIQAGNDFALDDISFQKCSAMPSDSCCGDYGAFCDRLENNVTLNVDNDLCKAILTVDNLPPCDQIQWIDWGDGNQDPGPPNGGMGMHSYTGSGTYSVCYSAIELDNTGLVCMEKLVCDTIEVVCDSCVCHSDLIIEGGGNQYPAFCDPHTGFIPSFSCPTNQVEISGYFGCADSISWEPCLPTTVYGTITFPDGSTHTGLTYTNQILHTFYYSDTSQVGLYCLTLNTICPGSTDTCVCKVQWIWEGCDTCCTDYDEFCDLVDQGFTVVTDPEECKATLTAPQFDSCHWFSTPPYIPGTNVTQVVTDPSGMWMFNFNQSGTYTVCVNVFEENGDSICWQKEMCTTFELVCDTCKCVKPDVSISSELNGVQLYNFMAACDDPTPLILPCPIASNQTFNFQGNAHCMPDSCLGSGYDWAIYDLTVPPTGILAGTGTFGLGGAFNIPLAYSQLTPGVLYEVVLTYFCGDEECTCGVKFILEDCGSPCPNNLVQNGMFEQGTPNGADETISLANDWGPIWSNSNSTGDFYNTSSAPSPFGVPLPPSQGNYGAMWCRLQGTEVVWREGIMNELGIPIGQNTGCYDLTFKLACLFNNPGPNYPGLSAFGVSTTGFGAGAIIDGSLPLNTDLFLPSATAVELGTYLIPAACDANFQTITFNFNSAILPASGITHIFFTRADGMPGVEFVAIDDVCLVEAPCPDTCCTTLEAFCEKLENSVAISVDEDACKATLNIGNIGCNSYIEWVQWASNLPMEFGPYHPGDMPMHTYPGSGVYEICYLAIELDSIGQICTEKVVCETIDLNCTPCYCGAFSDMFIRIGGAPSLQVFCDSTEVTLGCPNPGNSIQFTGLFQCAGSNCTPSAQVTWQLVRMPGNIPVANANGIATANPYFGINILPTWYATPGSYELQLTGHCGSQMCTCTVKFAVDCPDPCPCDVLQFEQDVAAGFANINSGTACKACFAPIALNDCDMVSWHVGSVNNPSIGTSVGNGTFCHTFASSGNYTIIMVVTRKKSDGSICEIFTYSRTVNVLCIPIGICTEPLFDNSDFDIGAVSGELGAGGASTGWIPATGSPQVLEGQAGSLDGWTILLSGNYDAADALTSFEPMCLERDTGTITLRAKVWGDPHISIRPCDRIVVGLEKSWVLEEDLFAASLSLAEFDSAEWVNIQIPFDLDNFPEVDSCGNPMHGAWVQPVVFVTNALGDVQGGTDTRSLAQVDYFCIGGALLTAVKEPQQNSIIRLFPNPTNGSLTVEFTGAVPKARSVPILDLYGRVLQKQELLPGKMSYQFSIDTLPAGMYFVQVIEDGFPVWTERVVKQ
ncbi:MAG TPA: T9SS type A sorting domain-containing protein [Saprospiraceae bacterium]|nr:T9SS type A sorting domain-containing protein [Saprospiraceae bacterium]HMQ82938.1 T9SS type A sorting domain-containing protein [Saprospiraceae bacterium]